MHQNLQRLLDTAPRNIAVDLTLSADRELRSQIRNVTARPNSIRKINVKDAVRIVEHLTDPNVLGAIYLADKRVKVAQSIRLHVQWDHLPHQARCKHCRENTVLPVDTTDGLTAAIIDKACEEQVCETLKVHPGLSTVEVWHTIVNRLDGRTDRLAIEVATGGIVVPEHAETPEFDRIAPSANMRRLLEQQPAPNDALLKLAAGKPLPKNWTVTAEQWTTLATDNPRGAILSNIPLPLMLGVLRGFTDEKLSAALPTVLNLIDDDDDAASILDLVHSSQRNRKVDLVSPNQQIWQRHLLELLRGNPNIGPATRRALIELVGVRVIPAIVTDPRINLVNGEVDDLIIYLRDNDNDGTMIRKFATAFLDRMHYVRDGRLTELIEAMVNHLPLTSLTAATMPDEVLQAVHRRLWAALNVERHGPEVVGMVPDWCGTVNELIECIENLD